MLRKRWTAYAAALSLCIGLLLPAGPIQAASTNINVTLPTFKVKLNGHTVENKNRQYPLLVFRGITYFPMTWSDTRLLGLETSWSSGAGLGIKQSPVTAAYESYHSGSGNAAKYTANIATSAITVNGKAINNAKEPYPLLTFRNITYFPLTWRFAHDEFGWEYKWSSADGLSITSHNPQLQSPGLPAYAANNEAALFKGYYYFVQTKGTTNKIMRAPVQQPSAQEEIYSYSFGSYDEYEAPRTIDFQIRDNALWFSYHLGGGVMGSDYFVRINDKGKAELAHTGYLNFRDTSHGTFILRYGDSAFEGGNLYKLTAEGPIKAGDPGLMYAVTLEGTTRWSMGNDNTSYIGVSGDDAYVLASRNTTDANSIYKMNLKTNKTEKVVDSNVSWFRLIDNRLYYVNNTDKTLYSSNLDGTDASKLSDHAVAWFDSIDGNLYYTTKKNSTQFELYKADPNGQDPLVWAEPLTSVQVFNNELIGQISGSNHLVLLDGQGRLSLRIADPIARVLTSDAGLWLQGSKPTSLKMLSMD